MISLHSLHSKSIVFGWQRYCKSWMMIHWFLPTGCCFSSLNLIFMTHDIVMFSCIVKDISQNPSAGVSFQNHLLLEIKASNLLLLRYFACRQSYVYVSSNIPHILDFSRKPMDLRIIDLISSIEHSCLAWNIHHLSIAISLDLANLGDTIWAVIFTFACSLHLTSHYCLYACLHYWLGTRMLVGFVQHQDNKPTTNSTKTPPTQPKPTKHCQVWRGPSLPAELLRGARMASPGPGAEHAAPCWDGARDVNDYTKC